MTRRDDWARLDDVRASIGDFLDAVGHEPLRIDVGHATLHVTRARAQYAFRVPARFDGDLRLSRHYRCGQRAGWVYVHTLRARSPAAMAGVRY